MGVGCGRGREEVGQGILGDQVAQGLLSSCKGLGLYSELAGEPFERFEEQRDTISFM